MVILSSVGHIGSRIGGVHAVPPYIGPGSNEGLDPGRISFSLRPLSLPPTHPPYSAFVKGGSRRAGDLSTQLMCTNLVG
jgi:hypothetical protein